VPTGAPTRVYVVDAHPLFLAAVAEAIGARPELECIGSATTGPDALGGIRALRPDVAVLDLRLPALSGLELLRLATADSAPTRIVVLSADLESDLVYAALAAGAAGYLSKDIDPATLGDAIIAVARGETVLSPDAQGSLADAIRHRDAHDHPVLTPRERAILALAAQGRTTQQIAARLHVQPATVKNHLHTLYRKLGASDRTGAVASALRRGLLK
jgi:two-component system nitrate/nitrite response regulator NarL